MRNVKREEELASLFAGLRQLSYYEYLGVQPTCDYVTIREAFYVRAQYFHPDRFLKHPHESVREQAYAVYKRIAEAYNVLIDPQLRRTYDEALHRGEHRLPDSARARRLTADEHKLANPFTRVYLRAAQAKLAREDFVGAWIDVRLGLSLEDARPLRLMLEQLESQMFSSEDQGQRSHD